MTCVWGFQEVGTYGRWERCGRVTSCSLSRVESSLTLHRELSERRARVFYEESTRALLARELAMESEPAGPGEKS